MVIGIIVAAAALIMIAIGLLTLHSPESDNQNQKQDQDKIVNSVAQLPASIKSFNATPVPHLTDRGSSSRWRPRRYGA